MPYDTPVRNLQAVTEVVYDSYKREVARALSLPKGEEVAVDLGDFERSAAIMLDVITLDSASCAPCQYMMETVRAAAASFGDKVQWREHKIKEPRSIAVMKALGVSNIPTICIDGKAAFCSIIPPNDELTAAISTRLREKCVS